MYTITTKGDKKNYMLYITERVKTWPEVFDFKDITKVYDLQVFDEKVNPYLCFQSWDARCLVDGKREAIEPVAISWYADMEYINHSL